MHYHTIKQPQSSLPTVLVPSSAMRSCERRLQIPTECGSVLKERELSLS